jgi:hypothetical protein
MGGCVAPIKVKKISDALTPLYQELTHLKVKSCQFDRYVLAKPKNMNLPKKHVMPCAGAE